MNIRQFSQNEEDQHAELPLEHVSAKIIEEKVKMRDGTTQIRKYALGKRLGKGAFAECFECTDLETKEVLAVKTVNKVTLTKSRAKQKMISEIKIHKSLQHQHVVKFFSVFEDSTNIYILLEHCKHQSLKELMKRRRTLHELEVQCYLLQIIEGLQYLHSQKVIHRDLKLGNLFLNSRMELKLGDFGLAAKLEHDGQRRKTICGTPNYIAPEVLDEKTGHSYEADIWSLGVIIFTLLTGVPPFEDADVKQTYRRIRKVEYSFPKNISEPAKDLISKIFNIDPSKRPSLEEILQHPFLSNGNKIPRTLPLSNLICPPSTSFLNEYVCHDPAKIKVSNSTKFRETAPLSKIIAKYSSEGSPFEDFPNMTPKASTAESKNLKFDFLRHESESVNITEQNQQNSHSSHFNNSKNLNNQAMISSSKDIKLDSGPQSIPKDLDVPVTTSTTSTTPAQTPILDLNAKSSQSGARRDSIYVKKWIDYSHKYGLGYILSNGSCGVMFNDESKIILEPQGSRFEYIGEDDNGGLRAAEYTLESYPEGLEKKVYLLKYFKGHLLNQVADQDITFGLDEESRQQGMVMLKKWSKTKHATLFRLSNKLVQVNFVDKTQLISSSLLKLIRYKNKKGEVREYPLDTIASSDEEVIKRLKYTKEMLNGLLENNQKENVYDYNNQNLAQNLIHSQKDLVSRLEVTDSS